FHVTGVQTCALPIFPNVFVYKVVLSFLINIAPKRESIHHGTCGARLSDSTSHSGYCSIKRTTCSIIRWVRPILPQISQSKNTSRSEERRVGKECELR